MTRKLAAEAANPTKAGSGTGETSSVIDPSGPAPETNVEV